MRVFLRIFAVAIVLFSINCVAQTACPSGVTCRAPMILSSPAYVWVDNGGVILNRAFASTADADAAYEATMAAFFSSQNCTTSAWQFTDPVTPLLGKPVPTNIQTSQDVSVSSTLGLASGVVNGADGTFQVVGNTGQCADGGDQTSATIGYLGGNLNIACPTGFQQSDTYCYASFNSYITDRDKSRCNCDKATSPSIKDPVNIANGFSYRNDTDISISPGLDFTRYYNSSAVYTTNNFNGSSNAIGVSWRTSYSRSVSLSATTSFTNAYVTRPDGQVLTFIPGPSGTWISDSDIFDRLTELKNDSGVLTGWTYFDSSSRELETYDATGKMLSFVMPEGRIVTLTYNSSNQLTNVSDDFGRSIAINYGTSQQTTGGQIQSITDQSGNVWKYTYDSNLFLTGVTYPDGSGIAYHYLAGTSVESAYLTEVGDVSTSGTESDFLWFTYAEDQNATFYHVTSTYESENANNVSFSSNNDDTTNAVTITDTIDANTTQTRTLNFGVQANILKLTSTQGSCPVGECAASAMAYNTNGLPNSITDFNGNVQALTYDAAGLIATQVDAQGQSVQRTTNTTWDGEFNSEVHHPTQ